MGDCLKIMNISCILFTQMGINQMLGYLELFVKVNEGQEMFSFIMHILPNF